MNANFPDIEKCSTGPRGVELQLNAEKQTHTVRKPYPRFVPTIVYNKVSVYSNQKSTVFPLTFTFTFTFEWTFFFQEFNGRKQWLSLRQFKKQLCDELEPIKKTNDKLLKLCAWSWRCDRLLLCVLHIFGIDKSLNIQQITNFVCGIGLLNFE